MSPATDRELRTWKAYLETGTEQRAADKLGVHVQTVKRHLDLLKAEHRVKTLAQLAVAMGRSEVA
jgi:predicted ArsR family transcriptional regulator